jgi:type IV secretion system protein VirB9
MKYHKIFKLLLVINLLTTSISYASSGEDHKAIKSDSRIKTFSYDENTIYKIVVVKDFQTSLEFEKGEAIQTVSLGSPYAWSINSVGKMVFIKPQENNINTNMTIITNRRVYNFEVTSSSGKLSKDFAYVVRFTYPAKAVNKDLDALMNKSDSVLTEDDLNF